QQQFVFQHSLKTEPKEMQPFIPQVTDFNEEVSKKQEIPIETQTQAIPTSYEESTERKKMVIAESDEESIDTFEDGEERDFTGINTTVTETERVPVMYPIGQMHGTYILAQNEKGLYIIDQHAAQERIKYEYFREKVGENITDLQELLLPITLEYSTDECININAHKHELEQVGIFLEPFGHNSYIVRSHPQWFPKGDEKEVIEEIIEQVLNDKKIDIKKLREAAAIMMSCKASIKANHHLRNDEIFALLETLRKTSDPFTCPHGRPIIIHHSTYEMEKMFKRVM